MDNAVPVYLFLGFLEAGKSKFIQETFEDERFDSGENTLLLVCEEGEVEFDPSRFAVEKFSIEYVTEETVTLENLTALAKKHKVERVCVEWNGMLPLEALFNAMPEDWMIAQVMTFFDSTTFLGYNANMRSLVYDKVQYTDMVVFNRFKAEYSKEEFHKIVRAISRRPQIVFEYGDGRAEFDETVDPLPYDIDAAVIKIEDRDYAYFYRDLMEETPKYDGKTVRLKGMVATDRRLKKGIFALGRQIMSCCAADLNYYRIVVEHSSPLPLKNGDWVEVTAKIEVKFHKMYGEEGPVLRASSIAYSTPPEEEVAVFY